MAYSLSEHEYQVYENGAWSASRQDNMTLLSDGRHRISNLTGAYAAGQVRVRVKAIGSNPPSDWLYSNAPFTGTASMPTNQLPTANAGADNQITLPTSSFILTGSGTDADGTIATYSWEQVSGPVNAAFSSRVIASPTVSGLTTAGDYVFSLITTDNSGGVSPVDQVKITVNPAVVQYTDRVNVVASGNSIVFGYQADTSYPAEMDAMLPSNFTITNIGIPGANMGQIDGQRGQIDSLWDNRPGATNVLMCQEGVNSFSQGQSVDDFYTQYNNFMAYFRAKGWKVIGVTPNPTTAGGDARQIDLISRMRRNQESIYDGLLDWGPNPHVGSFYPPSSAFAEWFPDSIHPSTKGQRVMGRMAFDLINKMFNGVPLPDQSVYPLEEVYDGEPVVFVENYQVEVYQNNVTGQPGIAQRDNSTFSQKACVAGSGLRGWYEVSLNSGTSGFFGISYRSGRDYAGTQQIALQVGYGALSAWADFIQQFGQVGSYSPGDRIRIEVWEDKVVFLNNKVEFWRWNNAPAFPCRLSVVPDGSGWQTSYYNCRQG
jgi:hypothetical protein